MTLVTVQDVERAARVIEGYAVRTPLLDTGPHATGALLVKPENLQPIGAFKIRGAANAVTDAATRTRTVVTHSSGNHGQAVAFAARRLGLEAVVVIPDNAPAIKVDAVRALGAEVVLVAPTERVSTTERIATERGAVIVPPFDDDLVIAGQGTVGLEIVEDLSADVEDLAVFVPVGGGGLLSGISVAVAARHPGARIYGVEPELAGDAAESFFERTLLPWPSVLTTRTIADGLRTGLSPRTWAHIERYVEDIVTVTEQQIVEAERLLFSRVRIVAEPSGAVATAGYLAYPHLAARTSVAVVSGGNVDPHWFARHVLEAQPLPSA